MAQLSPGCTPLLGFRKTNKFLRFPKCRPFSKHHDAFRFVDKVALRANNRVPVVYASSTNRPNPNYGKGKADKSSSSIGDGPPLLTIFAGVLVFLIVCWVIGSIVLWLVSLIVNVPSS